MTIQVPNPGTGNGATGDNEFLLWSKVKTNFEDQSHAASRSVGESSGNVMQVGAFGWGALGGVINYDLSIPIQQVKNGFFRYSTGATSVPSKMGQYDNFGIKLTKQTSEVGAAIYLPYYTASTNQICIRSFYQDIYSDFYLYTDRNTTKDSNGFIKAASPIVKVFADKVELNSDAESQNITYTKNDVGDYTITTISGLSTDGWYIELPKDINGNPKVAVTLVETNGVITLKSYKRIFSMTTFTFEPDLDEPLDIPDGRWIDLRLNEIPITDSVTLEPIVPDSEV
ncbi:phage tail fiber protein [Psychrobacter nivimaris]|uniref:phage tail fiber protein n=1 Tax=Psychrobacter nivimaris TaxID=281738 RepID=UPI0019191DEB|nr:hypothetical protein [Psychrobacter nivimaris]